MTRSTAMDTLASTRRAALLGALVVVAPAFATPPAGGSTPPVEDPRIVLARTVHPRIAYRGLERTENPVAVQATTFPAGVFHDTLGVLVESVAGDAELGARGSHGLRSAAVAPSAIPAAFEVGTGVPGATRPSSPLGAGASAAGAVGGATRNLGARITGALSVLPAGGGR